MRNAILLAPLCMMASLTPSTLLQGESRPAEKGSASRPRDGSLKEVNDKSKEILAEAAQQPDHPWAGSYYSGNRLSENLTFTLAPIAGVAYADHGCGWVSDWGVGRIVNDDGRRVHLTVKDHEGKERSMKLLYFRWGRTRYLVSDDKMPSFCKDVNSGEESPYLSGSLHGGAYLKDARETPWEQDPVVKWRPIPPNPDVSHQWKALLRRFPSHATVNGRESARAINDATNDPPRRMALIQLRINVGSKGRVQRGHKLVKDGDRPDAAWTVVNVEDDESLVEREIPIPAGKSLADVEASVPGKGVVLRIVWEP